MRPAEVAGRVAPHVGHSDLNARFPALLDHLLHPLKPRLFHPLQESPQRRRLRIDEVAEEFSGHAVEVGLEFDPRDDFDALEGYDAPGQLG